MVMAMLPNESQEYWLAQSVQERVRVVEADYYEHTADWSLERHLENKDELHRFEVTAGLILPSAERLLDVGTGNGAFLSFLEGRSSALDLCGLERSKAAIAASRCGAKIIEGSMDTLPFQDRAFDTVTALEVIEHLPHAVYPRALAEMARVASRQVLISVPYRERRLMVACPECGCRFSPIFHLRTFDENKLGNLVPGFHLTQSEYVSTDVHWLLTDLATRWRALRDRLTGFVPTSTTCPQCGYALQASKAGSAAGPTATYHRLRRLRSAVLSRLPKVEHAHWIVASYERIAP
jgi:ubiquinone/menaquinone biosynthesis C-methylase UbiE